MKPIHCLRAVAAVALCGAASLVQAQEKGEIHIAAGGFSPTSNPEFANPSGQYGFAVGFGRGFTRHISWGVDFLFSAQRVDTPSAFQPGFLVTQSGRADIETFGVGGFLKGTLPLGRLELYAGGGPGFYRSTLTVQQSLLGFPGEAERSDSAFGLQLLAGADLRLGEHWALGFQWRRLDLKASFGAEVPGEVKVGGNYGLLHLRWMM